jgi:hypothetical protein
MQDLKATTFADAPKALWKHEQLPKTPTIHWFCC